ncbi:MAG: hypothetical protein ACI808_002748, partial [Paraglaciecola sp.]
MRQAIRNYLKKIIMLHRFLLLLAYFASFAAS